MPRILRSIPQELTGITRRLVGMVTKDLLKQTAFPEEVDLVYEGEVSGSSKSLINFFDTAKKNPIRTRFQNYAFLTYKETFLEDHLNLSRWQNAYISDVFVDEEHGIRLRPQYATALVELEIKLRTRNLSTLKSWVSNLRLTHGKTNLNWSHDVDYEFDIPADFIEFIGDAYTMKEKVMPDGETLTDYLRRTFRKGVNKRTSLNGENVDLVCVEKQRGVLGMATDEFFYNDKEVADGIYEITIPYRYEYKKPIGLTMTVPCTIRNQLIPQVYIDTWVPKVDRKDDDLELPLYYASYYDPVQNPLFHIADGGSRVREWDDWFPINYQEGVQTVTIVPVYIDVKNPRTIFNIRDIEDRYLPTEVKEYLSYFPTAQGYFPESLVTIELFEVGIEEKAIAHVLSPALDLTSTIDMDPRKRYYIRIGLLKDLARYNAYETEKLLKQPDLAIGIFTLYDPEVRIVTSAKEAQSLLPDTMFQTNYKNIPSVLYSPNGTGITARSFTIWLRKLSSTNALFKKLASHGGRSVMNFNISASRR